MAKKLGARKNSSFKAIGTAPSINKTPGAGPVPYPVMQDLSSSVGVVPSVKLNGDPIYVLNQSTQPSCIGDNPGVGGGVKSGTVNGEVKPTSASSTVRAGKRPVVRDGDDCTLNKGNCPGKYVTVPAPSGSVSGGKPAQNTNPEVKVEVPEEKSWWDAASPWVHGALGVASFVPGLSVVTGALDAGIYAAEGNMVEAGIAAASMIPGGKVVTTAGKAVKKGVDLAQGAKALNATDDVARAAKGAKEAAGQAAAKGTPTKAAKSKADREGTDKTDAGGGRGGDKGKDGLKAKGRGKKKRIKCFCVQDHYQGGRDEYERQLKRQQEGINSMTASEYLAERRAYSGVDPCTGSAIPGGPTRRRNRNVTRQARQRRLEQQERKYTKEMRERGLARSDAKRLGEAKAQREVGRQDPLHNQDMTVGGQDIIGTLMPDGSRQLTDADFGHSDVNRNIGSQWAGERVKSIDAEACRMNKEGRGDDLMNVEVRPCGKREANAAGCKDKRRKR